MKCGYFSAARRELWRENSACIGAWGNCFEREELYLNAGLLASEGYDESEISGRLTEAIQIVMKILEARCYDYFESEP